MSLKLLITLCLLASTVFSSEVRVRSNYAVKERHHVPRKFKRIGPAPSQHKIRLQIGLKQSQFAELERHLYEVSDPTHGRYGQHLSQNQVNDLVKSHDETLSQVHDWLLENDIQGSQLKYSPAKDWIQVDLPVIAVERLLDTRYSLYRHEDGSHLVRTTQWSLPRNLHEHIDTIQPTNSFFRPTQERSTLLKAPLEDGEIEQALQTLNSESRTSSVKEACNVTAVTSNCLRTLYGTIDYTVQSAGENQIGLTNYLSETSSRSDTLLFLQQFRPDAVDAANNFTIVIIDNGDNQQTPNNASQLAAGKNQEGNLDAETIIGITHPTPLTAYNTGGSPPFISDMNTPTNTNEPYLTWLQFILAQENIPQVISTSYGDDEQSVPQSFATSVCKGFAQLGARGVSLLFSSGDNGVGSSDACIKNDGTNSSTFLPVFPGGCPYVTTVGGTRNIEPEIVAFDDANGYVSGGGFSNYFPRPSYQDSVVPDYVTSLNGQFKGLFNESGRAYPDIAAQGFRFLVAWNGTIISLDGTSAASPTAASIVSLVNDALIAAGKPVLGFLNPWLYSGGFKAFTDIKSGSTTGCGGSGFPAQEGWDAASGFGTPYFPRFQAAALDNGLFK